MHRAARRGVLAAARAHRAPWAPARRARGTRCAANAAGGGRGATEAAPDAGAELLSSRGDALGAARVVLKRGKARLFKDGNPLVYGGAVDCVVGKAPSAGDAVLVTDGARTTIAWGVYNATSMYRVRILQNSRDAQGESDLALDVAELVRSRVARAWAMRQALGLGTPAETAAYRLVNSEGDQLSGIVVDVFAGVAVVQSSAAWVERHKADIGEALLAEVPSLHRVVWRPNDTMLRLEGCEVDAETREGMLGSMHDGDAPMPSDEVEVEEGGLAYGVDLALGQKTGFYCDQRDNRAWLRSLPLGGKSVLDLCCYTGGFALSAAAAGAGEVIGVDSSERAIAMAEANAARNGLVAACAFRSGDAIAVAREFEAEGANFDVVVLDPPKLAPSAKAVHKAKRKYAAFNAAALAVLAPGGLLITHSCSGAVARSGQLREVVEDCARRAGRRAQLVRRAGAAPDHPVAAAYPEGQYLDCLCFLVS